MKFGFTTTSVRQIKSLEKIAELAVSCKADCIEWGGDIHVKDIETAKRAKKLCDENKIEISSYGSYYRVGSKDSAEWEKICRIASTLGASFIRVWLGRKNSEKTDTDYYNTILSDLEAMCDKAEEYGLAVCTECHDNTFNNNTDAFLRIQKDCKKKNFFTYFQSRYKKLNYDIDRIKRTLPFTKIVHISFSELRREQFPKYNPKYTDTLISTLLDEGFDGIWLIEYTYPSQQLGFPFTLRRDIAKLKEMVGKTR